MRALKYIGVGLLGVIIISAIATALAKIIGEPRLGGLLGLFGGMPFGFYVMRMYLDGR